ncbi:hypothetical protein OC835_002773 [Tilletia horrida]|nr:hypothetical protein OC835_002773 [Tilletia horrida]
MATHPLPPAGGGPPNPAHLPLFTVLSAYADALDALPLDLTRSFSDLRELDAVLGTHLTSLTSRLDHLAAALADPELTPAQRLRALKDCAEEARAYKEGGEDKIRVAVNTAETIASHADFIDRLANGILASTIPELAPALRPVSGRFLHHSRIPYDAARDRYMVDTVGEDDMPESYNSVDYAVAELKAQAAANGELTGSSKSNHALASRFSLNLHAGSTGSSFGMLGPSYTTHHGAGAAAAAAAAAAVLRGPGAASAGAGGAQAGGAGAAGAGNGGTSASGQHGSGSGSGEGSGSGSSYNRSGASGSAHGETRSGSGGGHGSSGSSNKKGSTGAGGSTTSGSKRSAAAAGLLVGGSTSAPDSRGGSSSNIVHGGASGVNSSSQASSSHHHHRGSVDRSGSGGAGASSHGSHAPASGYNERQSAHHVSGSTAGAPSHSRSGSSNQYSQHSHNSGGSGSGSAAHGSYGPEGNQHHRSAHSSSHAHHSSSSSSGPAQHSISLRESNKHANSSSSTTSSSRTAAQAAAAAAAAAASSNSGGAGGEDQEDQTRYCYCQQVSYGEMIACDSRDCPYEWFHLVCANLTEIPGEGTKWYCDHCLEKRAKKKGKSSTRRAR